MQCLLTIENWAVVSNYNFFHIFTVLCRQRRRQDVWPDIYKQDSEKPKKLETFTSRGLECHTRSHNSEDRILDSLTCSQQHTLCRHTYVKRDFSLKPRSSNLHSMLHTRHEISTSNVSKTQVYSHWFCNYKHATAPRLWVITPIIDTNKAANTVRGT